MYTPMLEGTSPPAGQIVRNPDLARTFREVGEHGATHAFYSGRIAEAIVQAVKEYGGVLEMSDLQVECGNSNNSSNISSGGGDVCC